MDDLQAVKALVDYTDMILRELDAWVQHGVTQGTFQTAIGRVAEKIAERASEFSMDRRAPLEYYQVNSGQLLVTARQPALQCGL
jgi:hypothetical protein